VASADSGEGAAARRIDIRRSTPKDIPGLWACLDSVARERRFLAMLEAPPVEEVASFAADPNVVQIVAVESERVVGWADLRRFAAAGFTHRGSLGMGVLASHRGRGLGGRLLEALFNESGSLGLKRVELHVFRSNAAAVRLYARHGFVVEGELAGGRILDGAADDILLMYRPLSAGEPPGAIALAFDRDFFRYAVRGLGPAFAELGFELAVEHHDYLTFGAAHAEFRRRGLHLRLVWDGKERSLRAETSPPAIQNWTNIEAGRPPDRRRDRARLDQLAALIRTRFPAKR
jgi:ribosomal protein S18 acetylase RimI-like enzyme